MAVTRLMLCAPCSCRSRNISQRRPGEISLPYPLQLIFIVLAEAASQRASAEKDGAASADTADTWLFPMMKGSSGGCDMGRAFAVTGLLRSVCPAVSGTEIAGTVAE